MQNPAAMTDDDFLALLQQYAEEGRLDELFQPFGQEQQVLDQEMALAQQLRQPGRERSTPMGALLSGLSNAVGNVGGAVLQQRGLGQQRELGGRMQTDASSRMRALIDMLRRKQEEEAGDEAADVAALLSGMGAR